MHQWTLRPTHEWFKSHIRTSPIPISEWHVCIHVLCAAPMSESCHVYECSKQTCIMAAMRCYKMCGCTCTRTYARARTLYTSRGVWKISECSIFHPISTGPLKLFLSTLLNCASAPLRQVCVPHMSKVWNVLAKFPPGRNTWVKVLATKTGMGWLRLVGSLKL